MAETNEGVTATPEVAVEKEAVAEATVSQAEYDKLNETIGSLKRDLKDAKKSNVPAKTETPEKTNTGDSELLGEVESLSMQVAGLTTTDEVKLATDLKEETGMPMKKLLASKYFKSELQDVRDKAANAEATTGVKGDKSGSSNIKQSADYWISKGESPTREQVPDRKVRAEIRKAFVDKEKGVGGGNFYNS